MGWTESEINRARTAMLEWLRRHDPYYRAERQLVTRNVAAQPMEETRGRFSFVMRQVLAEPGIVQRIHDEGFDAGVAGKKLDENPHTNDGPRGWWRTGWEAADYNLRRV